MENSPSYIGSVNHEYKKFAKGIWYSLGNFFYMTEDEAEKVEEEEEVEELSEEDKEEGEEGDGEGEKEEEETESAPGSIQ